MNRDRNREPQPVRIALETEALEKVGHEFKVLATAIITQGKQALEGQMVQFFLSGTPVGNPTQTDENGRVQYEIGIPLSAKSAAIEAQLVGQATRGRKIVSLLEEKKLSPPISTPLIRAEGDEGEYLISVSAIYEDGKPATGVLVRFLVSPLGKPAFAHDEKIDANGFALYSLSFSERECDVTVQIKNFEQKIENLYGPSKVKRPPEVPEPPEEDLRVGIFKMIYRAWKKGSEDLRRR